MSLGGRGQSGKHKPDLAKMEGDIRALKNAIADLQAQINLHGARLEKVEIVKAGPQEPDIAEPQRPETE